MKWDDQIEWKVVYNGYDGQQTFAARVVGGMLYRHISSNHDQADGVAMTFVPD